MGQLLHTFFSPLDFLRAVPQVWSGFQFNIKMMVVAEALVLVLALFVAIVRGLPGRAALPFRAIAIVYTDVFRGTPLVLVLFMVLSFSTLNILGLSSGSLFADGVIALTIVYTAYVTEVYRAGIESVHPSQRMAARSLVNHINLATEARTPWSRDRRPRGAWHDCRLCTPGPRRPR